MKQIENEKKTKFGKILKKCPNFGIFVEVSKFKNWFLANLKLRS
jgi:hypothetical protein